PGASPRSIGCRAPRPRRPSRAPAGERSARRTRRNETRRSLRRDRPPREVTDERRVDRPPGEPLAQLRPVDAGEIGLEAEPDEGSDELGRVPMPDREDALHADPRQVPLAIGAEILQEDVPEGARPAARLAALAP